MISANATPSPTRRPWVMLTGATGVLGSQVLHELLARNHRVLCLVRADTPGEARRRLADCTVHACGDVERYFETGQLAVVRGDLHLPMLGLSRAVGERLRGTIRSVIHSAGSVVFTARRDGEPSRTNIEGTRAVFAFASSCGCRDWHLVSTAYVCGRCADADEVMHDEPTAYRNDYEYSKWTAEHETRRAAQSAGATLTVYRPGVIVGHSRTGAASRFTGIYYLFRAVSLLAKAADQHGDDRRHIPLRIRAAGDARPNLSFVDDVARELVDIFDSPAATGGVFHLTHPKPPSNAVIKRALETFYNIGGGTFTENARCDDALDDSTYDQLFTGALGAMSDYLLNAPRFDRNHTDRCVRQHPTPWSLSRLVKLLEFAEGCDWRPPTQMDPARSDSAHLSDYFEHFMPRTIAQSKLSQLRNLDLSVRYVIDGAQDGDWLCQFCRGHLQTVQRAPTTPADITYRLDASVFWRLVAGRSTTSEIFLSGGARIEGDVERALKFAGIIQDFVSEFPYDVAQWTPDAG
ncbi:MAG: SDR family oxidoreductase [Phycisphaerales bacterium]|nr:SDR family oxidoreductase [Phycisphaerales bacterium]